MPTYEYRCTSCGDQFEIVQSFKDASLTVCERCQGTLRKVYGNVGISFKGTGFYKNDSKSAGTSGSSTPSETSTTKTDSGSASPSSTDSSSSAAPASSAAGSSHGASPAATPSAS